MDETDDPQRLTREEMAFLLHHPAEQARRAERNSRGNARRTERRHSDPAYAEQLRLAERERQRRRRIRAAIGRADPEESPAAALPPLSDAEAMRRLRAYLQSARTAQSAQLKRRPELLQRYVACFAAYRAVAGSTGRRPTRGELARFLESRFGLRPTPAQIQKLRDHVERFAGPGGPWQADRR